MKSSVLALLLLSCSMVRAQQLVHELMEEEIEKCIEVMEGAYGKAFFASNFILIKSEVKMITKDSGWTGLHYYEKWDGSNILNYSLEFCLQHPERGRPDYDKRWRFRLDSLGQIISQPEFNSTSIPCSRIVSKEKLNNICLNRIGKGLGYCFLRFDSNGYWLSDSKKEELDPKRAYMEIMCNVSTRTKRTKKGEMFIRKYRYALIDACDGDVLSTHKYTTRYIVDYY